MSYLESGVPIHEESGREAADTSYRDRAKTSLEKGEKYRRRRRGRHRAEMALVERAFSIIPPPGPVLDIPCGAGRMTVLLARNGYDCTGAEVTDTMVSIAREAVETEGLSCPIDQADIEAMSYPEARFHTVLCFRLFHHFPNPVVRRRVVGELCRVAEEYVALSYLSPFAFTSLKRRIRVFLGGKESVQHATSLAEVKGYFGEQDFALVKDFAQMPFFHTLHLAVFRRT